MFRMKPMRCDWKPEHRVEQLFKMAWPDGLGGCTLMLQVARVSLSQENTALGSS